MEPSPKRKRLLRLALVLGALPLAFAAGELYLRLFRPVQHLALSEPGPEDEWKSYLHRASSVPGLAYELAPGAEQRKYGVENRTNGHGMRDLEPVTDAEGELARIAVLGDSVTFGFGVPEESTYPRVLEVLLNERQPGGAGRLYDVLNFGVGGYSTRDEALVLEHKALAFEPDLVIVGYSLNDPEIEPFQPLHTHYLEPAWWRHSHLLRLAHKALRQRDVERLGGGDYHRYLHAHPAKWKSVEQAFADIRRVADGAGCDVLVAIFPQVMKRGWAEYPYHEIHAQVAAAARAAGLLALDLLEPFSRQPQQSLRVSPGDAHPSAAGHAIAAQAIADYLAERPVLLLRRDRR